MEQVFEMSEIRNICEGFDKELATGRKIPAIRLLRSLTNFNLRECKDIIDAKVIKLQTVAFDELMEHAKKVENDLKDCGRTPEVVEMLNRIYSFLN